MDSATKSVGPTKSASKQVATMQSVIVKDLAESLVNSAGLLALSNELERKGMPNQLKAEMSVEEASKVLLEVVQNHSLLPRNLTELKEVMKRPPSERADWAMDQLESNLSNQDH